MVWFNTAPDWWKWVVVMRGRMWYLAPTFMALVLFAGMVAITNAESVLRVNNPYIDVAVRGDYKIGTFTIGTTGGDPLNPEDDNTMLLYGHPNPWSSYVTIRIDGMNYYTKGGNMDQYVTQSPHVAGDSIITKYKINGIEITQTLEIVQSTTTGKEDTVKIEIRLKNTDNSAHSVGVRILFDTMPGSNDGAPFYIPFVGSVTTEREFTSNNIPEYWQAFDRLSNPKVISQGTLKGGGATAPDKFVIGNWEYMFYAPWDYQVDTSRSITGDSAAAIYWNPVTLSPNAEKVLRTYYGLGRVEIAGGIMTLGITAPSYLSSPDAEFTLTAYVENTGSVTANDVTVEIILPNGLTLGEGETPQKDLGDLPPNSQTSASWLVRPTGQVSGNLTIRVVVSSSNVESTEATFTVFVPETSTEYGYFGIYYNLPSNHPDMETAVTGIVEGLVNNQLPLTLTDLGGQYINQFDWYSSTYYSFSRIDRNLTFGSSWFPVNENVPGDPLYFSVHWQATLIVPSDGVYQFEIGSDDDSWLFIDNSLIYDLGGIHPMSVKTGAVYLTAGEHLLDIYYAERHSQNAGFYFRFLNDSVIVKPRISETIPDNIDDTHEQIVSKYYPSFDWRTQTPDRNSVLQAVINAVIAYFTPQSDKQAVLNDVIQLVQLYFSLPS